MAGEHGRGAVWAYGRRRLTRLEAVLFAALVSVLIAVLLDRLYDYFELAERATVEVTLANLQSSLNVRLAQDLMTGRARDLAQWRRESPFTLARTIPSNYLGEFAQPRLDEVDPPAWLFDRGAAELVYVPRHARLLRTADGSGVLRFRLVPEPAQGAIGVRIAAAQPYEWQID